MYLSTERAVELSVGNYSGIPDGLVQGQGNGFPPSHPDTVFIGVLAHPT